MDLKVKKTRNGKGISVTRDFKNGDILYEVTGIFISGDEDEDIDDSLRDNAFRFDEDRYISPNGSIGDFQNHSCEPNAKVQKKGKKLFVVAVESIRKGEEVLIDYSTIIGADDSWIMVCNCGSAVCRTSVRSFDRLPRSIQKRYILEKMVPSYIVKS